MGNAVEHQGEPGMGARGCAKPPSWIEVPARNRPPWLRYVADFSRWAEWSPACPNDCAKVSSNTTSMVLSPDLTLIYVLSPSGLVGRVTSGRVSRNGTDGLVVCDAYGRIIEYLSEPGGKVRSWCLLGAKGKPVDGWSSVLEQDRPRVFPFKDSA